MEKLKKLLGDELYKQVSEKLGDKKYIFGEAENYVPKHRFDEVNNQKNEYEKQVKDYMQKVDELTKNAKSTEEITSQMEQLKADYEKKLEEAQAKQKELSINSAIKLELSGKVHDVDIVSKLIDTSKLELDDAGNIKKGLEDQIKTLKESKSFLFVPEKQEQQQQSIPGFKIGAGPNEQNQQKQEITDLRSAITAKMQGVQL